MPIINQGDLFQCPSHRFHAVVTADGHGVLAAIDSLAVKQSLVFPSFLLINLLATCGQSHAYTSIGVVGVPLAASFSSTAEAVAVVVHQWIQSRKCCANPPPATMLQFSMVSLRSLHIHERCRRRRRRRCRSLFELLTSLWFNCPDFVYIIYFNPRRRGHKNSITIPNYGPKYKFPPIRSVSFLFVVLFFCILYSHF